ncbi:MAG: Gfo/Idh/MocA family oxidoreductase [Acidobacteria bacterium]|nr:Gfo/Idh/MocA family oxidoreductase [Acidobacteriota bacterium]
MSDGVSRRHFFYGTLLAGAVPTGGFGSVPSLRALGYKPFYDKLNVAVVGCGGQGGVDLNDAAKTENVAALCDVDETRAAAAFSRFSKAPKYKDYRAMLDKEGKNIDACIVATPDFMHATVALACMQQGKHVYVEKPLTRTPWEARLLRDAAAKYKVATQMGNQGFSHECHRVAAEIVWSGEIGEVREAHVATSPSTYPTELAQLPPEKEVPTTLDWNLWLGNAPARPFSEWYIPYNWRGFYDFGTGQIGNWATHTAGPVHTALQLGAPESVECVNQAGKSQYTFPSRGVVRLDFPARGPMPPVSVYYHEAVRPNDPEAFRVPGMEKETILPPTDNLAEKGRPTAVGRGGFGGGRGPGGGPAGPGGRGAAAEGPPRGAGGPGVPVFQGSQIVTSASQMAPRGGSQPGVLAGNGSVLIGSKGVLATSSRGEGVWLLPSERWKEYKLPPQLLTRSPGHMVDWVRACKGGDPSCSDFSITAPYAEWLALVCIAWRVPGKLQWDSKNTRFTNSEAANQLVKPVFRRGSELKL